MLSAELPLIEATSEPLSGERCDYARRTVRGSMNGNMKSEHSGLSGDPRFGLWNHSAGVAFGDSLAKSSTMQARSESVLRGC